MFRMMLCCFPKKVVDWNLIELCTCHPIRDDHLPPSEENHAICCDRTHMGHCSKLGSIPRIVITPVAIILHGEDALSALPSRDEKLRRRQAVIEQSEAENTRVVKYRSQLVNGVSKIRDVSGSVMVQNNSKEGEMVTGAECSGDECLSNNPQSS